MPVRTQRRGALWRVVEGEPSRIATNAQGSPLDGGGHRSRARALAQVRAVNASLAQRNDARHRQGQRNDTRVVPRHPRSVEARYARYMRRRVQALGRLVRTEVLVGLNPAAPMRNSPEPDTVRTDALNPATLLAMLRAAWERANPVPEGWLIGLAVQVDETVRSPLLLAGVVPVPSPPLLGDWVSDNTALIRDIDRTLLDDVAALLIRAQAEGMTARTAGAELSKRTGIALRRARFIARNEIATINAALTKQRQTGAGVREFIWRTSQDERVRDEHAALEGTRWRWDAPPPEGVPGQPIGCRCTAEPVLDEIAPT